MSSFGCKTEITSELEQLQYRDQLNAVKSFMEMSTSPLATTTTSSTISLLFQTQANKLGDDSIMSETNSDLMHRVNQHSYKYLENFIHSNCFLPFYLIEIIHSGVFIFIGVFIFFSSSCCCIHQTF